MPDRGRVLPTWLATPVRLAHFLGILVAVFGAAIVLAVTVAASPLLLSSAGSAALRDQVGATSGAFAGLRMAANTQLSEDRVAFRARLVHDATRNLPFGPPVLTLIGSNLAVVSTKAGEAPAQLLTREDFLHHIQRLQGSGTDGFWVPSSVAKSVDVRPGDSVDVEVNGVTARALVAGIYRDISPFNVPPFWFPVISHIAPPSRRNAPPPPPLLLASIPAFLQLEQDLVDQGVVEFDLTLDPGLTLERARRVSEEIGRIQAGRFDPASPLSGAFDTIDSGLPQLVKAADDTVAATSQPLRAVSLAGTLVALVLAGAAGAYGVRRRQTEIGLLSARGVGPGGVAARSAAESVLPVAAGTLVGWIAAIALVRGIGPSSLLGSESIRGSLVQAAVAAIVAVALLGASAGVASRGDSAERQTGRLRALASRWPWEIAALAAAAASLYEILTRGTAPVTTTGPQVAPKLDLLVLLFPFLFVAGTSGLVVRWLRGMLPRLKRATTRRRPWMFLAASRLASAPRSAASLVAASALALGILTYAGVLASSIAATSQEKSTLSIGADVALTTATLPIVTGHPPFNWTPVTRLTDLQIVPQDQPADVLAIDPRSFARTAFWKTRLGGPLRDLTDRLLGASGDTLPALVAGGSVPPGTSLAATGKEVPIDPVASLGDFPGARRDRITLVVAQEALQRIGRIDIAGIGHFYEVWARGDPAVILPYLENIGLPTANAATAKKVRTTPAFLALSWTFGVLEAFGVLAGLIAALGVILYLQARQQAREVSYSLARRMGLAPRSHLRSVAAELATMLIAAFVLGAGFATAAAALVHGKLDPIPSLPPSPFLVTPLFLFGATGGGVILVSLVGAWWVQRRADRANPAEVMRLAG